MDTLDTVRSMAPGLMERADETESGRRLPADVVELLGKAGCYRMLVPARFGGDDRGLPYALRVIEELSRADGSAGWFVGQAAQSRLLLTCFPEPAVATVFRAGPDVLVAGAVAPKGRATAGPHGRWRVSGVWPFVTGCADAAWYYLNCLVVDGRTPRLGPGGVPETRMVAVPAGAGEILDTWYALGLRGTGSHDVRLPGVPIDAAFTFTVDPADPASGRVVDRIAAASLVIAACVVGLAEGALTEVRELATGGKRPAFSPTRLAASPVFHDALGEAHAGLRAARAVLYAEATAPSAGIAERAALRAGAARSIALATAAVDTAYTWAGGSAVFDGSPLQRRWRDTRTASQHAVAGRGAYPVHGALLVGAPVPPGAV